METKLSDRPLPTAAFRRSAWQRFQLSLDPLGSPQPLPAQPQARPVGKPFGANRAA